MWMNLGEIEVSIMGMREVVREFEIIANHRKERSMKPETIARGMNMNELCAYVGRSSPTIRKMIAHGLLPGPAQSWGRKHLFDRKAVDAALDAMSQGKAA
jgi:excisionase family DNA binding protein